MPQAPTLTAKHPSDLVVYALEGTINDFFASHISIKRQECDEFAASLYGDPVNAIPIQGCFSYTVVAGHKQSKIVQFRAADSNFDTNILELAHRVHGQHLVPACTFHGQLGTSAPLSIYSMEKLSGDTFISILSEYMKAPGALPGPGLNPYNTILDFALFFAAAWKARQVIGPYAAQEIHADYQERFKLLSQVLPSRYQQNLEMVRGGLSLLFIPMYPMVLNHGDLCGMNFLVDPHTGHLNGVIDWAEAQICPFGISLWGLENILGTMDSTGWHYHPDHEALRIIFWKHFEEAVGGVSKSDKTTIQVARMAGLFLRYGFHWQTGGRSPVDEGTSSYKYLDALCATCS
ncbi:hypothetical protein N7504_008406 [Penicillium tannophilum]|nr:hypothetical protein N7504_008406 [Penicillium tannophilum]